MHQLENFYVCLEQLEDLNVLFSTLNFMELKGRSSMPFCQKIIYLFLAVPGLHYCMGFSLAVASWSYSSVL